MLGAIDPPSIHCLQDNTCGAISSPTEQGELITIILKKTAKTKKILKEERFVSLSLKGISFSIFAIIGEINLSARKPMNRRSIIANVLGAEYNPRKAGSLLLSRLKSKASNKHQYPGSLPIKLLSFKLLRYQLVILSQSGFFSAWLAISSRICSISVLTFQFQAFWAVVEFITIHGASIGRSS